MKNIFLLSVLLLFVSCDKEEFEIVNMRVNHHQQIAVGLLPTFVYQIQEGDQAGTEDWSSLYAEIEGFDYEWGYVYDLRVAKMDIDNPPADASSVKFELREVVSKEPVSPETTFTIRLRSVIRDIDHIVIQNTTDDNFSLLEEQVLDCVDLCDQLVRSLENENEVTGVFRHGTDGSIILQNILLE